MSRSLSAEVLASRYRLDHQIASGGMGSVWRAVDLVLDRPVAVKLLRAEFAQHPETIARFRAEARHAAGLSHPSIAQVYDFGEAGTDEPAFLVLELVDGPPLTDLIRTGPLPPDQVMDIVAQVASGLAVAHAAGVVHRDIKPGNLLLDSSGIVKITDFGVAYAAGSAPLTRTGTLLGTPAYLAPERVAGQAAGPASDLYSLGMVAYECLSGAVPFSGTAMEVALAHKTQWLPPLPASVPAEVAGLVADLTAKDPGDRPAAASDVATRARALRDDARAGGLGSPDVTAELPVTAAWQQAEPDSYGPVPPADAYGASSGQPWQRGRSRTGRGRIAVMAAAIAVAASLAGWLIAGLASAPATPRAQPPRSHASAHTARTVTVNAAALLGRPVRVVVRDLRDRGLRVAVTWQPARDARPGTVLAVQPAGKVLPGTTVQVTAASREHGRGRGHDHGHGHDGNGQGGN
ncbi:MAG TPA: serine/threonine-protein kinase [Streptosporangiaceae bacterium]|nr:serine/threonine-protein kinase [Streptosporangiaceae bacterium]